MQIIYFYMGFVSETFRYSKTATCPYSFSVSFRRLGLIKLTYNFALDLAFIKQIYNYVEILCSVCWMAKFASILSLKCTDFTVRRRRATSIILSLDSSTISTKCWVRFLQNPHAIRVRPSQQGFIVNVWGGIVNINLL